MVDPLSVGVRALSFVALFQAAGIATFIAVFGSHLAATRAMARRVGLWSALAAIALVAVHYGLEPARMAGELTGALDFSLQSRLLHSSIAAATVTRLCGLALIVLALRGERPASKLLTATGVALVVASFALVGHTAQGGLPTLPSVLLFAHLVVLTFWFGALVPLHLASTGESAAAAAQVTTAFSRTAVWIVPGLFVAGALLAALLLPSMAALGTPYGKLLLAKIAAFAGLMVLGALNKWRFGPALARGDASAAAALRRALAVEYVLIGGTFAVTAVMTSFYSPH